MHNFLNYVWFSFELMQTNHDFKCVLQQISYLSICLHHRQDRLQSDAKLAWFVVPRLCQEKKIKRQIVRKI